MVVRMSGTTAMLFGVPKLSDDGEFADLGLLVDEIQRLVPVGRRSGEDWC